MKVALTAWYNRHVAARWWASSAMWVGIAAGLVEFVPDWIQTGLDNVDLLAGVFALEEQTKRWMQAVMLFVILPIAKAWRQEWMTQGSIKQAAEAGRIVSPPGTDAIVVKKTDGEVSAVVHPAYSDAGERGV